MVYGQIGAGACAWRPDVTRSPCDLRQTEDSWVRFALRTSSFALLETHMAWAQILTSMKSP